MKTKKVLLLMLLCAAISTQCFSQTTMGRQNVDQYPVTAWGTPTYGLTWLPSDYASNPTQKYPLIIFLHGSGEGGDGVGGLNNLLVYGLPSRIAAGWDPQAVNPVDGQNYKFIVVSPQAPSAAHWSYAWGSLQWVLADVINRYRIDTTRIYVTGISAGGAGAWSCYTNGPDAAKKFAAIVPVSAAGTNSPAEGDQLPLVGGTYNGKVWNVCGALDAWMSFAITATNTINTAVPSPSVPALLTPIPNTYHEPAAWNTPYDPNWRNNSQNLSIYEWMLKYTRVAVLTSNAGSPQTIVLPASQVNLSGSGAATQGNSITAYAWTKMSGPASYNIVSPSSASTQITGLVQGVYVFRLTVTDNLGGTAFSDVTITVNTPPNIPPVANAGAYQTIILPASTVTLNGSGTDADGTVASYAWTKINGPATYTIVSPSSSSTQITGLVQGVYTFRLTVTDNQGATGFSDVFVNVNTSQSIITIPGRVEAENWSSMSGVQTETTQDVGGGLNVGWIDNGDWMEYNVFATTAGSYNVAFRVASGASGGQFQLKTQDGTVLTTVTVPNVGWQIWQTINATVNLPAGNQTIRISSVTAPNWNINYVDFTTTGTPNVPPVASAGTNQTITLPTNSVTLNGSGTDADGTIASYAWTKISGPTSFNIVSATSASTQITGLIQGVYVFRLTVTDNSGATASADVTITVNAAANVPPVASAGTDQTITLPTNSVTLNGSGTDADGSIASYAWTKISGPTTYTIVSATSASTQITGLIQGVYVFRLTVTDNSGATASADVTITVNAAANVPPVASAGTDQTITLPTNSVTLNGSGTDADGTIASYVWTKISGPTSFNIVSATSASTQITGLIQGVYIFRLTVTDNSGATASADVTITVNAAANVPPVASAGTDQTITLPTNSVTLNGSGTDADGSIASYAWTKISGPTTYTIVSATSASTQITGLIQGVYVFRLTVTDNSGATASADVTITVNAAANVPPVASAGTDQTITLPTNSVTLNGSGTDADGTIASYVWTKISGPTSFNIVSATSASTQITGLIQGVYIFRLTVTDNSGATASADVTITVNAATNVPPVASAGTNQTITLPTNSVTLNGSGTDADGTIASYAWTKVSGPVFYNIVSASSASTQITGLIQGVYVFRLTVTDNSGAIASANVTITVNAAANVPPIASAGTDQTITLPTNSVTLTGSGTDADGTIASYAWTKISGPTSFNIVSATSASTQITGLIQGVYVFRLTVTDNSGATASADVTITVNAAANVPPVASAGTDQTITLPTNSVTLNGSGTDADGTIASYAWTKVSGPGFYNFSDSTQAGVIVNGLHAGTYTFSLTVTDDGGLSSSDTINVQVNSALNIPPVVFAGNDTVLVLPVDSTILNGTATDADGSIASYAWTKISGPLQFHIADPTQGQTTVDSLLQGTYQFELAATDDSGMVVKDTVMITVSGALNLPPLAYAGVDTTITLPQDSVALQGNGVDTDGTIVSYLWKKISGPLNAAIADSTQGQTSVDSLVEGVYQFELTVTDDSGAVAKDTMQITVNPHVNIIPLVNAGIDTTITLPIDSVTLMGVATDADGTISNYSWSKVSGPVQYSITAGAQGQATMHNLMQGVYQFELMATDNDGGIGRDTITVTVNAGAAVTNCNGVKRYIIPGGDQGRYINGDPGAVGWYVPINPGDTVILGSQYAWSYFSMENYSGTASCPIVVMNEGGQVWLTAGIEIKNSHYIKITGSGNQNTYYGFRVYNPGNDGSSVAISVQGKSRVVEVERVDVYKKTYGVWAKQDPLCDLSFNYPNYVMDSIEIHHCRFKNIGQDCIYAGNTDPTGQRDIWCNGLLQHYIPMRISNFNIHHLIIDSCNRTGIQISGADQGYNQIHDNVITRCGYEFNQQQGTGISIGGMTKNCHVYNNTIKNTFLYGILSFGAGVNYIENNTIDSTGWLDGVSNTVSRPANILASPKQTIPFDSTTIIVRNNKLGLTSTTDSTNIVLVAWGPPTWSVHNVVCNNTKLDGLTPAQAFVAPTIVYINDCSVGLPNMPPTAYAGNDIVVNPPADTTSLHGSASDPDGTIVSYHWTKISGPAQFTINNPDQAQTGLSNLVLGVYTFRLTVTDNDGLTASDDIQISIAPPNTAPLANAGGDQMIFLPTNQVTLNGSAIDPDGTIVSYQWTKISGPASYATLTPTNAQTQIINLVEGVYTFELKVVDNSGAQASDTVRITVNPAPPPTNVPPVANAGIDQVITLPTNFVTLNGSGTDADGSIVSYQWTKISGPATYSFSNPSLAQTMAGNLMQGVYQFELQVIDNQGSVAKDTVMVTVNPAPNVAPVVNAGADQTISLPVNSVTLNGSATDPDGNIVNFGWTKISGPSIFTIASPGQLQTAVTSLIEGVYQFELTAVDNEGAISRDTVMITVNAAVNVPPVASAGTDQTITLPTNSVTLNGSGTDADGTIASYAWTKVSGPVFYNIVSASSASTQITGLIQGVYVFRLTVTDNSGATASADVTITVNAAANVPPVASAGTDQTITLPTNSVTLNGSGTDADGTIASYVWTKISGPTSFNIVSATSASTQITGLIQGVYIFRLTVTDNSGATASADVTITVNAAANVPPVASAGTNQTITLPTNSVTLNGSGTDADGTIASYAWTKVSGPVFYNIVSASSASTQITGLIQGVYVFRLTVTDNSGATASANVTITVNAVPNVAPVANAGTDIVLTLPVNFTALNGSGIDVDGSIVSYQWAKISGPLFFNLLNANNAQATADSLLQGTYKFELTVTDNQGATGKDTVTVIVNGVVIPPPVNIPPVAIAGDDQTITLPVNSVTLNGGGTDADGTVTSYAWTKISGPSSYTIVNPTQKITPVQNLTEGSYQFELKVTDNQGAIGKDTLTVIVKPDLRAYSSASIFPDPVSSTLNLKIEAVTHTNLTTIKIYDERGMLVHREDFLRTQQLMYKQIDVANLPSGAYLIVVGADINRSITLKFVKQ